MFWKQKPQPRYPSSWKPYFIIGSLCVGYDAEGNEIWASWRWVERRWTGYNQEEFRAPAVVHHMAYTRIGLHPY